MKFILLRHAETLSNKANRADSQIDSELTKKGLEDARSLVPKLKKFKIDLIVVSPLRRNVQTLQPFLDTLNDPKIVVNELILERNLGDFTGTPMGTFQKYCDDHHYDKIFHRPKNGESIADTYERSKKFLATLKAQFPNHNKVLICGHKNFLMCLEILVRGLEIGDFANHTPLKNAEFRVIEA